MFTWKQILCILIFSLIMTGISRLLRKELLLKGKNPFPLAVIIYSILMILLNFILRAL